MSPTKLSAHPLTKLVGFLVLVLVAGQFTPVSTSEAQGSLPDYCFTHADVGNTMNWINRINGADQGKFATDLSATYPSIETLALNNLATRMYTVNDAGTGEFGEMDFLSGGVFSPPGTVGTGAFTLIGNIALGRNPNHPAGTQSLNDVDSLSIHPWTDQLWAITQDFNNNLLFRVDPNDPDILVQDTFGPGIDYVEVDLTPANFLDCTTGLPACGGAGQPACPDAVDDLGIDPTDGAFYAIANDISALTIDWIVEIQIDDLNPAASPGLNLTNGTISVCAIGVLRLADNTPVTDMEGFAFYNDGTFYGTTGDQSILASQQNRIWTIDEHSGVSSEIGAFDTTTTTNEDFEGVACLTGGGNLMDGYVFNDVNGDGVRAATGEAGEPGVTVFLFIDSDNSGSRTAGDILIQTKDTDTNGFYEFAVGIDGPFFIDIDTADIPAGTGLTTDNAEEADFTGYGGYDPNNNFGFNSTTTGSIGDFVWNDLNGDGLQTAGEPGIAGVTVNLYTGAGVLFATTTTDGNGGYTFANVPAGDYELEFIPPTGFGITGTQNAGADDTIDSDVNPATRRTGTFTLNAGQTDTSWDAGMTATQLASVGDFVWQDLNGNGIQDSGEAGLGGVTVNLLDSTGATVATTVTSAAGAYNFSDVPPGDYRIQFVAPSGAAFSPQDQGANDGLDSDADATGLTSLFTLSAGQNDISRDAGLISTQIASVGDFVWDDQNQNGIQDPGEPGLAGATVNLFSSAGTLVGSTTTTSTGAYNFTVPPGDYRLQFIPPATYDFSPQDAGADDTADSDVSSSTGFTGLFTLAAGDNDTTRDAGMFSVQPPYASVGNFVWDDQNQNGIQDPGEPGIPNVRLNLFSSTGALVRTTLTNSTGAYLFADVIPGSYRIQAIPPSGYGISPLDAGGDDTLDNDFDPATGFTAAFTLVGGQSDLTWDLGLTGGGAAPAEALPSASTVLELPFPTRLPETGYAPSTVANREHLLFIFGGILLLSIVGLSLKRRY
jgi:hypothetical protein